MVYRPLILIVNLKDQMVVAVYTNTEQWLRSILVNILLHCEFFAQQLQQLSSFHSQVGLLYILEMIIQTNFTQHDVSIRNCILILL